MARRILFTDDASRALAKGGDFLARQPVQNNLLLTLLSARAKETQPGRYWTVREGRLTEGMAFQSPLDFPAVVSRMGGGATRRLVEAVHDADVMLPGVTGDARTATRFAAEWAERAKTPAAVTRAIRLYEAKRMCDPPAPSGSYRAAAAGDAAVLGAWAEAFFAEIDEHHADAADMMARRIETGQVWVWDDDGVVSVAVRSLPVAGVARVVMVYTPAELRGRGYAGACVAQLTRQILDEECRCALYADLANPIANSVYRRIGYRPVSESLTFRFGEA